MILSACVKRSLQPWVLGLSLLAVAPYADAEDLQLTVGLKTWVYSWTTWGLAQSQYNSASYETVTALNSDTQASVIPQLLLRYGPWLVSTSYMTRTRFDLSASFPAYYLGVGLAGGDKLHEDRQEFDANVGYYVIPGLAVTVGYKKLDENAGGTLTWSGPTVGLAGTVPMGPHGLSAYGTFGYGLFHLRTPQLPDADGRTAFSATYVLAELGLAYTFQGHYTVTLGYRSQTAKASGYALSVLPIATSTQAGPYTTTQLKDLTEGPTLGLAASF
jgi:hypothetical protein